MEFEFEMGIGVLKSFDMDQLGPVHCVLKYYTPRTQLLKLRGYPFGSIRVIGRKSSQLTESETRSVLAVYWIDFQVHKSKRTEEGDVSEVVCVGACFCNSEKGMRDYGGEIL